MIVALLIVLVMMGFVIDTMQTRTNTPQFLFRVLLIVAAAALLIYHMFIR